MRSRARAIALASLFCGGAGELRSTSVMRFLRPLLHSIVLANSKSFLGGAVTQTHFTVHMDAHSWNTTCSGGAHVPWIRNPIDQLKEYLDATRCLHIVNARISELLFCKSLFFVSLRKELIRPEPHRTTRNCTNPQNRQTAALSGDAIDPSTRETAH